MITFADALASITDNQPPLTIPVGVTEDETLKVVDLAKAPHALLAGETGSGKSVGLNSAICTLMSRNTPDMLRFTMIDPKRVELSDYRPSKFVDTVITDMDEAAEAITGVVKEMMRRYKLLEDAGVKNISSYNAAHPEAPLAFHVLVVDELADLMDTHADSVFPNLVRLGQLARAAGIHMLIATQRPAADTTPKKLVSNIPTRFGYRTQSHTESNIILGAKGAEKLAGNGAVLAKLPGAGGLVQAQGPYISEDEIKTIVAEQKRTDAAPTIDEEEVDAAAEELSASIDGGVHEFVSPAAESGAPVTAPAPDMAATISAVVTSVTQSLEASARVKIDAAEADTAEAKRQRDELAEELSAVKLTLETERAQMDARIDAERVKSKAALDAALWEHNESRAEIMGQLHRAAGRHSAALGRVRKVIPWTIIGGAIASLVVFGMSALGLTFMAVVAPLGAAIIVGLCLTPSTMAELPLVMKTKEERNGQHIRSGEHATDRRHARSDEAEGRPAAQRE